MPQDGPMTAVSQRRRTTNGKKGFPGSTLFSFQLTIHQFEERQI